ncbi:hypothetical protein [Gloeobacter violaceus]|uniref:Gsr3891 protein n=1 Tax=Gloeobacter violaceus (strain ATCC 29082 / PCC 7421) TaxID=251221 RepID=Q7NEI8_GLOVI|nr:hypothetical protein [Gloeobacter violaceus]BAC91832.1 gsr3891 [Gloeobacter violaceus PCC 7421]
MTPKERKEIERVMRDARAQIRELLYTADQCDQRGFTDGAAQRFRALATTLQGAIARLQADLDADHVATAMPPESGV